MNNFTKIPPFSAEELECLERLSKMTDADIDYSDIPPTTKEELERMKANRLRRKKMQIAS